MYVVPVLIIFMLSIQIRASIKVLPRNKYGSIRKSAKQTVHKNGSVRSYKYKLLCMRTEALIDSSGNKSVSVLGRTNKRERMEYKTFIRLR